LARYAVGSVVVQVVGSGSDMAGDAEPSGESGGVGHTVSLGIGLGVGDADGWQAARTRTPARRKANGGGGSPGGARRPGWAQLA
jgi:hypothetical protein